ncbi:MAG: hypothetical protein IJ494_02485 [Bacteroides sp.]|nr:hypothetical protein [Bacteroides sp.]
MTEIQYMNECMMRDLAMMLIKKYNVSLSEALDILYNSETFEKLQDERTGLYFQSPVYVFDFLQKELSRNQYMIND